MVQQAYVYILSSTFQKLYIGITTQIEQRTQQHKEGGFETSFTSRYNIDKLVYFERFTTITAAIAREKQLKRWSRIKKDPPHRRAESHLDTPEQAVGQTNTAAAGKRAARCCSRVTAAESYRDA